MHHESSCEHWSNRLAGCRYSYSVDSETSELHRCDLFDRHWSDRAFRNRLHKNLMRLGHCQQQMRAGAQRRLDLTTARLLLRLTAVVGGKPEKALARFVIPARL